MGMMQCGLVLSLWLMPLLLLSRPKVCPIAVNIWSQQLEYQPCVWRGFCVAFSNAKVVPPCELDLDAPHELHGRRQ